MKKVLVFSAVAMFVLVFSSCRKDFTCTCTFPDGSTSTTQIDNQTQSDAESDCDAEALRTSATSCTL